MKQNFSLISRLTAFLMVFSIFAPVFALGADAKTKSENKPLTEDRKISHVLNRLGFGARPGDVAKGKAIGLNKYIEQQLNAPLTDNAEVAARLKNFEVLNMETDEIFAKYPNGNALLRQLEGRNRNNQNAAAMQNNQVMMNAQDAEPNADERRERQQKIREYQQKYDLRPPAQITQQMQASRIVRAVYSENQLQEAMTDFWLNHFNVYAGKAAVRWFIPSYERDVIRKNALGNFKDLVKGTAQHPAMLFYLDNFQSMSPNTQIGNNRRNPRLQKALQSGQLNPRQRENLKNRGLSDEQIEQRIKQAQNMAKQPKQQRGINENYARELMELHTLGVDGGYTQKDIVEVARSFTGWTIADPRGYRSAAASEIKGGENRRLNRLQRQMGVPADIESGEFYFNEKWHDSGEKVVLGQKINEGGMKDGLKVVDVLAAHPSTAKFIARKLAVKFVNDNPNEALVTRVAQAFQKSGGDIKTTLRALFNDKEFYAPENYRAKIKTPFELLASSLRALDADVKTSPALVGLLGKMGEPLYGYIAPTGYPDTAEDWVNTGALLERMNFAVALASNRIPQTKVNLAKFEAKSKQEILNKAVGEILEGEISASTRTMLLKQLEQPLPEVKLAAETDEMAMEMPMMEGGNGGGRRGMGGQVRLLAPSGNAEVFKVVGLILGSPDFQRQ
ncbi:MAG: DUF1800 domain-containing protein [Pyrinomonadaceae bacterium]